MRCSTEDPTGPRSTRCWLLPVALRWERADAWRAVVKREAEKGAGRNGKLYTALSSNSAECLIAHEILHVFPLDLPAVQAKDPVATTCILIHYLYVSIT